MPDAPDDPELTRLLDAYGQAEFDFGKASRSGLRAAFGRATDAHLDLLAYIARAYVRRDRLRDDGPWEPGDGSPYAAALEAEDDSDA